jgi:uncharacterized protein YdhG (YjbR/CyaY superfamily)
MAMFEPKATTVAAYLARLPPERRATVAAVRRLIKRHLPKGYREAMNWGAITYEVPLRKYPSTYNGQPLCYVALTAKKAHLSLYLMAAYGNGTLTRRLRDGFRGAGKRLNMGKACIRFRKIEDLDLDAISAVIASTPMDRYIAGAEAVRTRKR